MFNLKQHGVDNSTNLLKNELRALRIIPANSGYYITVGDVDHSCKTIDECKDLIESATKELKKYLFKKWQILAQIAKAIQSGSGKNEAGLSNLLFLNYVKRSFLLSRHFSDLSDISQQLKTLYDIDIEHVESSLIHRFNAAYLNVRMLHYLVMSEIYRLKVIKQYKKITKQAISMSGPFVNTDLPEKERMWPYAEDEEYFDLRNRARQNQSRYNPEYNKFGYMLVWQDFSRDPYRFEDRDEESPYPSDSYRSIP